MTRRERAWVGWATGHARSDLGEPLTHPTICPVCGAEIFFHTNGNGDVVFFDDLGWPWPKHPCLTTEGGIKVAARSPAIQAVGTLVARPSTIPLPHGIAPAEFDADYAARPFHGVVVRKKDVTVWWRKDDSAIRQRLDAVALALYTGAKRAIRVYAQASLRIPVGEVLRVTCSIRELSGRDVLWAESVEVVVPGANGGPSDR